MGMRRWVVLLITAAVCLAGAPSAQEQGARFSARWRNPRPTVPGGVGGGSGVVSSVTLLLSEGNTACVAPTCTSSGTFSVGSGNLGLLFVHNGDSISSDDGADAITSVSQTGQTWTEVASLLSGGLTRRIAVYCTTGAGAAAAAVTANFPNDGDNQDGIMFQAVEVDGADMAGTCVQALAAVQSLYVNNGGSGLNSGSTYEPTIGFASRGSGTALVTALTIGQTCTETARAGFTNLTEASYASPTVTGRVSYNIGGSDTNGSIGTLSSCSQATVDLMGLAVEVDADATGGDTSDPVCEITTPTSATTFNATTAAGFVVAGTCLDNDLDNVTITCPQCAVTGAITGTSTWTSTHTLTCSGGAGTDNVFTVTGEDGSMNTGTDALTANCRTPDNVVPTLTIQVPATDGTTVGSASQVFSGVAADETNLPATGVTWSCPSTTCTPDSGTATGSTNWTFTTSLQCSGGAGTLNTVRVVATDLAGNATTKDRTITCATADVTDPVVTITSSCGGQAAGANCTVTSMPQVISGTASDNVALRAANPVTGSSPACSPATWNASGSTTWTSPAITCPAGSVTHTITATDAAGNDATDTQAISLFAITTNACAGAVVGSAYTACTLSATGGGGTLTWSESGSNLGTGACTRFTLADSGNNGVLDDTGGAPNTAGTCTFTAQVTDGTYTATKQFSFAVVAAGGAGPHDFFNTWKNHASAVSVGRLISGGSITTCASIVSGDEKGCGLRSQAQINMLSTNTVGGVAGEPQTNAQWLNTPRSGWKYEFGTTDTLPYAQDAAKGVFEVKQRTDGQMAVSATEQMVFNVQPNTVVAGDKILIVFDYWWEEDIRSNYGSGEGGIISWKTFMIDGQGASRIGTLVDYIAQGVATGDPAVIALMTLEHSAGMGGRPETSNDPDCIVSGQIANGTTCVPNYPVGMSSAEGMCPAGSGAPCQRPFSQPNKRRLYHSKWTRYWIEYRIGVDESTFTDWQATECLASFCDAYTPGINANPRDPAAQGRWNMVSIWRADEDHDVERVVFRAPVGFNPNATATVEPVFAGFRFENNTSKLGAIGEFVFYGRNLFMLKNYNLPATSPETDAIFARPVR